MAFAQSGSKQSLLRDRWYLTGFSSWVDYPHPLPSTSGLPGASSKIHLAVSLRGSLLVSCRGGLGFHCCEFMVGQVGCAGRSDCWWERRKQGGLGIMPSTPHPSWEAPLSSNTPVRSQPVLSIKICPRPLLCVVIHRSGDGPGRQEWKMRPGFLLTGDPPTNARVCLCSLPLLL